MSRRRNEYRCKDGKGGIRGYYLPLRHIGGMIKCKEEKNREGEGRINRDNYMSHDMMRYKGLYNLLSAIKKTEESVKEVRR